MQPWRVYVLMDEAKDRLTREFWLSELEPHREKAAESRLANTITTQNLCSNPS